MSAYAIGALAAVIGLLIGWVFGYNAGYECCESIALDDYGLDRLRALKRSEGR